MFEKIINNYELLEKLDEGAYGSVYKVKHVKNKEMYLYFSKVKIAFLKQ
jgi:hypothetical protein